MRVEGFGCEPARDSPRERAFAAGAEMPADDDGVRAGASEPVVNCLQHAVRVSAGLVFRGARQDGDVDGTGAGGVDRPAQASLIGCADRELCSRVHVDGTPLQSGDGGVDLCAGVDGRAQRQRNRRRGRERENLFHDVRSRRARRRAP